MAFDANDLSPIEAHVVDRTREGEIVDFSTMRSEGGLKPLIRAGFLRRLLLQLHQDWIVRMPGVRVRGARLEGVLDLADCAGAGGAGLPALELLNCDLGDIDITHARLARLSLAGAKFARLVGTGATIDSDLDLSAAEPVDETAVVLLRGAAIAGDLRARGARLAAPAGGDPHVLDLQNARIDGALTLDGGFRATGCLWLAGARIGGDANLATAQLAPATGFTHAMAAQDAQIGASVKLTTGFRAEGDIVLTGARIGADLELASASIRSDSKIALVLDRAQINGELIGDVTTVGQLRARGAQIGANFDLRGASLTGAPLKGEDNETALDATSMRVGGALLFQNTRIRGEALLADARIDGYCAFGGGRFLGAGGWAIRAPNLRVGGNLTFKTGATEAEGPIAAKTVVEGGAKFERARIEGELAWDGLELRGRGETVTLSFADAQIDRAIVARGLMAQNALIDLSGARCEALEDDLAKGWGLASTQIALDGFSYARLDCSPADFRWNARTRWLRERSAKRGPQPYAALARVYADAGRKDDMRRALRAQHEATARGVSALSPTRIFSALFGFLSGYGLSPTRAAAALSAFLLIGIAGVFAMDMRGALVTPAGAPCAGAVEPVLYAVDVALPVIDLGQESACAPGRAPGAALLPGVATAGQSWRVGEEVALWRWAQALYAVIGAVLTALALVTFSGVMKPKD